MDAVEVSRSEVEPSHHLLPEQPLDICRVCLVGGPIMRGIFFHGDDAGLSASDKAMSLASVKMELGDGLPSHICCDCEDKLEAAYRFKLQVEQADSVLHDRLDSLGIKEELFFSDVDVNLSNHVTNDGEITDESLLLKDHMDLLSVHKISETDDGDLQIKTQIDEVHSEEHEIDVQEDTKDHELSHKSEQIEIEKSNPELANGQQIHIEEDSQVYHVSNDQSFGTQELQDMVLDEISGHEKLQMELSHSQQLIIHEHDYVAESQLCEIPNDDKTLVSEVMEKKFAENGTENSETVDDVEIRKEESILSNASCRSQHDTVKKNYLDADRDSDEENYFENLNLSSRLKHVQIEKSQKVFFICYLCDRQFLSKEVLKEHMHSHEEVRKTLGLTNSSIDKLEKTPEKPTNSNPDAITPSSGKRPNTCPHCGKEYLYIISYNKHLRQHEREKSQMRDDSMPLEVSFQEDDDTLDLHGYDGNSEIDYERGEDIKEEVDQISSEDCNRESSFKCDICDEEFSDIDKLKNHSSQHVIEEVLTESNPEKKESNIQENITKLEEKRKISTAKKLFESSAEEKSQGGYKCPTCFSRFSNKRSLTRHIESHSDSKFTCKLCLMNFNKKELLGKHLEEHDAKQIKSFECTQCKRKFCYELTLRNHLIATGHKTFIHGREYDTNKRVKRESAKAAQKIIDQIKTDLDSDDENEDDHPKKKEVKEEKQSTPLYSGVKEEDILEDEHLEYVPPVSKKFQRNTRSLFCSTCNLRCSSKQSLAKHVEQHTKDENEVKQEYIHLVKTEEMGTIDENDDENEEDDDNFEGGLDWPMDSHECTTCKKRYSTKKSLLRHQLLHEEPNFECDICNVKFYRKDKLKAHYDKCSERNPDQVRKCNICGDTFENNEILKEHRAKHVTEGILTEEDLREIEPKPEDKNGEKPPRKRRTDIVGLECTECNKQYTSRKGLLRHIQVHEGKKYLCDICPKKFYRREHLKIHVAKHNMIKPYKCPRCTKRFIKEEQLNNHIVKHDRTCKKPKETGDTSKRFLCEICSKSFTQSTTLIAHLRAHNGIKPYVCEVCSRPFTTNAYLKMHMRTHTQERPYICQYCSRAFARADTLANHLTSHTGEAKYHCKYCPKHFRRLKSLKEHVFIHTGQRPYACPTCDRRFNNNGSRYAHSKRCKQNLQSQMNVQSHGIEQEMAEEQDQLEQEELQQFEQQEIENQLQQHHQRIVQPTISQAQIIKPQNIKTITITRPDGSLGQQHVMAHQEILMPLILPLTVTLADVGEEVILPEGTKIFTT